MSLLTSSSYSLGLSLSFLDVIFFFFIIHFSSLVKMGHSCCLWLWEVIDHIFLFCTIQVARFPFSIAFYKVGFTGLNNILCRKSIVSTTVPAGTNYFTSCSCSSFLIAVKIMLSMSYSLFTSVDFLISNVMHNNCAALL